MRIENPESCGVPWIDLEMLSRRYASWGLSAKSFGNYYRGEGSLIDHCLVEAQDGKCHSKEGWP